MSGCSPSVKQQRRRIHAEFCKHYQVVAQAHTASSMQGGLGKDSLSLSRKIQRRSNCAIFPWWSLSDNPGRTKSAANPSQQEDKSAPGWTVLLPIDLPQWFFQPRLLHSRAQLSAGGEHVLIQRMISVSMRWLPTKRSWLKDDAGMYMPSTHLGQRPIPDHHRLELLGLDQIACHGCSHDAQPNEPHRRLDLLLSHADLFDLNLSEG